MMGIEAYRAEVLLLKDRYLKDQAAIVRVAAERLGKLVGRALDDLERSSSSRAVDATMEERFVSAWPLANHIFIADDGRLLYPDLADDEASAATGARFPAAGLVSDLDVRHYIERLRQQRRMARRLKSALRAELRGKIDLALKRYATVGKSKGDMAARALLGMGRLQRRKGKLDETKAAYTELKRRFMRRRTSDGVSYALLADVGLATISKVERFSWIHQQLVKKSYDTSGTSRRFYLKWTVDQLEKRGDSGREMLTRMRRQNRALLASLHFGRTLRGVVDFDRLRDISRARSLRLDSDSTLVFRRKGRRVVGYAMSDAALGKLVAQEQASFAEGNNLKLSLWSTGDPAPATGKNLLHSVNLPSPLSQWTLGALRGVDSPLDEIGSRHRLQRLGLVVALLGVLAVGLLITYRAVRQELHLAQLKSDFASNISHELKTPLTSIRMYAEMLKDGIATTDTDRCRYQETIIRESERLGRLIGNVLDFSQLEKGSHRYDLVVCRLSGLVEETIETFRRLHGDLSMEIQFSPVGSVGCWVFADRGAAVQCLLNLLNNAAKYRRPEDPARVKMEIVRDDRWTGVSVRDHGIGIAPADQTKIFEDFFRAARARSLGVEGTGLGLALVRRHMAAFGGRVELESVPGKGSTFTLWFSARDQKEEK